MREAPLPLLLAGSRGENEKSERENGRGRGLSRVVRANRKRSFERQEEGEEPVKALHAQTARCPSVQDPRTQVGHPSIGPLDHLPFLVATAFLMLEIYLWQAFDVHALVSISSPRCARLFSGTRWGEG